MLEVERARLLRQNPWDATGLSEELYAMFGIQDPQLGTSPQVSPGGKGIQFGNYTEGSPIFTVNKAGGGSITLSIDGGSLQIDDGEGPQDVGGGKSSPPSASSFPGNLTGYLGNNLYNVTIYQQGFPGTGTPVTATQLGGDQAVPHAIDGSVWATVMQIGQSYFMTIPVWE